MRRCEADIRANRKKRTSMLSWFPPLNPNVSKASLTSPTLANEIHARALTSHPPPSLVSRSSRIPKFLRQSFGPFGTFTRWRGCSGEVMYQKGDRFDRHVFRVSGEEGESRGGVFGGEVCARLVDESRGVVGWWLWWKQGGSVNLIDACMRLRFPRGH